MARRIDDKAKNEIIPIITPTAPIPIETRIIANPSLMLPEIMLMSGRSLVFKEEMTIPRNRFVKQVTATSKIVIKTNTASI